LSNQKSGSVFIITSANHSGISSQEGKLEYLKFDNDEENKRAGLAERVLETYSPSGEESDLASLLLSELQDRGLSAKIDPAGNVISEIGRGPRSLLLCPHIDTVPGFLPVRREGTLLYGRGACDAKGALLSMLFAFEDLAEEYGKNKLNLLSSRVVFAGVVEEERESAGLSQLITDGVKANAAIFGEPCGLSKVAIGYRGHIPISFEILTKEGHASAPWNAKNAAEVAFFLYENMRTKLTNGKDWNSIDTVSVAITRIESGTAHNVIPGLAKMSLDIRLPFGTSSKNVISEIEKIAVEIEKKEMCKITSSLARPTEPYRARLDSKIVRAINRSILKLGFDKPSFVVKSGTGDMNTYAETFDVDALTYGPGDTKLSHTSDEFVDLAEVFDCAKVLVGTAEEFFGFEN
jgi:[amino group carrier protein]-lysine/ornithine hydrolase